MGQASSARAFPSRPNALDPRYLNQIDIVWSVVKTVLAAPKNRRDNTSIQCRSGLAGAAGQNSK
jgi:hypothetical protein